MTVVLTSRPEEFADAVNSGRLHAAAVIHILPLDLRRSEDRSILKNYLLADQIDPQRAAWREVVDHLCRHPQSAAARALSTPLNLALARDSYAPRPGADQLDPRELLAVSMEASPTSENEQVDMVVKWLIGRFLHQAYPDSETRMHASRWLGWIALRLNDQRDLAWWQISTWLPRRRLSLVRSTISFGSVGVAALIVGGATALELGFAAGLGVALLITILLIAILTLGLTFLSRVAENGPGVYPRLFEFRRPTRSEVGRLGLAFVTSATGGAFAGGALLGLTYAIQWMELRERGASEESFMETCIAGGVIGSVSWSTQVLTIALQSLWFSPAIASPAATPNGTFRADRRSWLGFGLLIGIGLGVVLSVLGLALGAWGGMNADVGRAIALWLRILVALIEGLIFAAVGLLVGLALGGSSGILYRFTIGSSSWLRWAEILLRVGGHGKIRFMVLLEDALSRQVLRQVGPVYQFRHAALQEHLALSAKSEGAGGEGEVATITIPR
jgi:hypothetical protein